MHRRSYVIGLGGALTAGLAGCAQLTDDGSDDESENDTDDPENESENGDENSENGDENADNGTADPAATLANPSFEDELADWTVGTDLPSRPGDSDEPVDHDVSTTNADAADGERCLELYIEGVADDGTIWVEQSVDLTGVERVTVDVYSEMNSANRMSQVAFFAGEKPDGGLSEEDFNRDEDIEDHSGWKTYSYSVADLEGEVTLAVGMNIVWETTIVRRFDNVRLVRLETA